MAFLSFYFFIVCHYIRVHIVEDFSLRLLRKEKKEEKNIFYVDARLKFKSKFDKKDGKNFKFFA